MEAIVSVYRDGLHGPELVVVYESLSARTAVSAARSDVRLRGSMLEPEERLGHRGQYNGWYASRTVAHYYFNGYYLVLERA